MHRLQYLIVILMILMAVGCNESTGEQKEQGVAHVPQPSDSLYTQEAAMNIYAYQPLRALLLIDSAVIVGHMDESMADQCRARIYAFTQMFSQVDSLLGGPESVRFDSAQAVGERLLHNDSVKADVNRLRDVLEVLAYANRIQGDTLGWIKWSRQLVDVCHKIGSEAETDALRTEAEIASAFPAIGRYEDGMERLDSVIALLSTKGTFDGLDALVIALKRKIALLGSRNRYAETLPLSRQIIERLDDYEAHPDLYHDGSHREPTDSVKRADYIRFYALYHMGGIYLDSDVEVLKSFDDLLDLPYFMGAEKAQTPEAAIIGAEKGCDWIKACLDYYTDRPFVNEDGSLNIKTVPDIMINQIEPLKPIRVLSLEDSLNIRQLDMQKEVLEFNDAFFSPKVFDSREVEITPYTYAIHHYQNSWFSPKAKAYYRSRAFLVKIFGQKFVRKAELMLMPWKFKK